MVNSAVLCRNRGVNKQSKLQFCPVRAKCTVMEHNFMVLDGYLSCYMYEEVIPCLPTRRFL